MFEDYYKLINGKTKQSYDEENPTQEVIAFHEGILAIVDDDIAKTFRDFGHIRYCDAMLPLLSQIARNLRDIVVAMTDCDIQIGHRNNGHNNGGDS